MSSLALAPDERGEGGVDRDQALPSWSSTAMPAGEDSKIPSV